MIAVTLELSRHGKVMEHFNVISYCQTKHIEVTIGYILTKTEKAGPIPNNAHVKQLDTNKNCES